MRPESGKKRKRSFAEEIEAREKRKIEGRRKKETYNAWFGLGMFGLVGWSVAIPTLVFTLIGLWLDARTAGDISWTLTGLAAGVIIGSLNAWRWVKKESGNE